MADGDVQETVGVARGPAVWRCRLLHRRTWVGPTNPLQPHQPSPEQTKNVHQPTNNPPPGHSGQPNYSLHRDQSPNPAFTLLAFTQLPPGCIFARGTALALREGCLLKGEDRSPNATHDAPVLYQTNAHRRERIYLACSSGGMAVHSEEANKDCEPISCVISAAQCRVSGVYAGHRRILDEKRTRKSDRECTRPTMHVFLSMILT